MKFIKTFLIDVKNNARRVALHVFTWVLTLPIYYFVMVLVANHVLSEVIIKRAPEIKEAFLNS